ncbi:MAG: hypothetical protein IPL96_17485 [Holophagaceae bacterium]|nr:hypothetical protein [Holophagaceae bacterium]
MEFSLPRAGVLGRNGLHLARVGAVLLAMSCGGGGGGGGGTNSGGTGGTTNPPPANTINVGDVGDYGTQSNVFYPSTLTVARGTTVAWVWKGAGHAMQSGDGCAPDGKFSSNGVQSPGYQMTHTFDTAGTYNYYCTTHCGQFMKGTVIVQ